MDTALHQFVPPLTSVAWLGLVPLCTVLILLAFILVRHHGGFRRRRYLLWLAGLMVISLIPFIPRGSALLSLNTHRLIYEASAVIEFGILFIHGRTWLKGKDWVWIFGLPLMYGVILENGGILMGFFREEGYLIYLPLLHAPVVTMIGWVSVLYCAFFIVERVLPGMRPFFRGLIVTGIGLSMDIPFDPVATRLGWWTWNDALKVSIWGVPAVNYIAWFWALFPYAWCYYRVRGMERIGEEKRLALCLMLMPVILVVELVGLVISLTIIGDQGALEVLEVFFKGIH